jgi:hypothetical protein
MQTAVSEAFMLLVSPLYMHMVVCWLQVKSYLAGNPPIKIKLNDDLLITRRDGSSGPGFGGGGGYGSGFSSGDYAADSLVILEDANFHEVRQTAGWGHCVCAGTVGPHTGASLCNLLQGELQGPCRCVCILLLWSIVM